MRKSKGRESEHLRGGGSCKTGFDNPASAARQAERLRKVYRTGRDLQVYLCGVCHRFHVGKKRSRRTYG